MLANIAPNKSLAAYSASEWLTPIRGFGGGITAPSRADYINAREAGLVLLEQDEGDWIPKSGLTSDGDKVNRIRMEGIVGFNIGEALKPFKSEPSYPSNKTAARVAMERKMDVLAGTEDVPESQLIRGHNIFEIDATATSVLYKVDVKTFGDMDSIIANVTVGPTVDIEIE